MLTPEPLLSSSKVTPSIRTIQVGQVTYDIIKVLFSSMGLLGRGTLFYLICHDGELLRPVLLAGRDGEQGWFRGRRDLDCSAPRVRWLRTPLHGKAEAQGSRPSKPKKKGTHPIGNSRGIAARVGRLLSGSGKALDTFLYPLHDSGLVEGGRM